MSRVAIAVLLGALSSITLLAAPAGAEVLARPDPVLVSVHLDYVDPLSGPGGTTAALVPLDPAVAAQAVSDETYLHYRTPGDLGGFAIAPVGASAFSSGGEDVVGSGNNVSQIPQYGETAEGVVRSFAFISGGGSGTPDNGRAKLPGLGVPPLLVAPINSNAVPPPNQGFGGRQAPEGSGQRSPGEGKRRAVEKPSPSKERSGKKEQGGKSPSKAPTIPTTPSTTPTNPSTPPTTSSNPPAQGEEQRESGASCGTHGLKITSDHSTCRIYAINMAPGQSASEVMTVRDEASVPVTLSLRASGEENRFWGDLRMAVWPAGSPAPDPLPELLWWTTQDNVLTTLQPNQAISYEIELYLPSGAGNEDQGQAAVIDLTWSARQ